MNMHNYFIILNISPLPTHITQNNILDPPHNNVAHNLRAPIYYIGIDRPLIEYNIGTYLFYTVVL